MEIIENMVHSRQCFSLLFYLRKYEVKNKRGKRSHRILYLEHASSDSLWKRVRNGGREGERIREQKRQSKGEGRGVQK